MLESRPPELFSRAEAILVKQAEAMCEEERTEEVLARQSAELDEYRRAMGSCNYTLSCATHLICKIHVE